MISELMIGLIAGVATSYACHSFKKIRISSELNINNNNIIMDQIKVWGNTIEEVKDRDRHDYFCLRHMKNGGSFDSNMKIEVVNYTENTPWFFRV